LPEFTWTAQRLRAGPDREGERKVVTFANGQTPGRNKAGAALRRRAESLGLPPLRNHDLRHLHASLALGAGVPLVDVSRRLGHANVATTATIYAHVPRDDESHVSRAVERALGG